MMEPIKHGASGRSPQHTSQHLGEWSTFLKTSTLFRMETKSRKTLITSCTKISLGCYNFRGGFPHTPRLGVSHSTLCPYSFNNCVSNMPSRPEEEGGQADANQHQAAGEVYDDGDQLMLSVAENLAWSSTLPNSRKHQNSSWIQWPGPRDAES